MSFVHPAFISYRQRGFLVAFAKKLKKDLEKVLLANISGTVNVFLDTQAEELRVGNRLSPTFSLALRESACLIVLYTPIYIDKDSAYCAREFATFRHIEQRRLNAITPQNDRNKGLGFLILSINHNEFPPNLLNELESGKDRICINVKALSGKLSSKIIEQISEQIYTRYEFYLAQPQAVAAVTDDIELLPEDHPEVQAILQQYATAIRTKPQFPH